MGTAVAVATANRGARVTLLDEPREGAASAAAAGMLAPSVERIPSGAQRFAEAARDRYPSYVSWLAEATGEAVPLNTSGILQLFPAEQAGASRPAAADDERWLTPRDLASLEPALAPGIGAVFHPQDGAVDNVALLRALLARARSDTRIARFRDSAVALELDAARAVVRTGRGDRHATGAVVLAAGAWSGRVEGLPRPLPVEPVRGQLISLGGAPLRHVVVSGHQYLVPRGERTVSGSTMEHVGFDVATDPAAIERLRAFAAAVVPALGQAPLLEAWAGLRPGTPDLLPILGRDPDRQRLIYACGHSRNGVLLAPLTADCLSALVAGEEPPADLSPFGIERFEGSFSSVRPGAGER